jgi:GNAT superfamily N-acetyltransferase
MELIVNTNQCTPDFKSRLNALMSDVFGFNFEAWQQRGFWNDDYCYYSAFEGGQLLSCASAYRMDMLLAGEVVECIQVGGVATRPDRRGEGLARQVMNFLLAHYPGKPIFLFPNETVLDFYPRFGFRLTHDRRPVIRQMVTQTTEKMQALTIDDVKVGYYLEHRSQYSKVMDCTNSIPVNWFHMMSEFKNSIYEIPDFGVLLVAGQKGERLTVYDIVATRPVTFIQILPCLNFSGVKTIAFGFNPDWLEIDSEFEDYGVNSALFIKNGFDVRRNFIVPYMIRT